jgi:two-component system, NtrC family, response regulator AtoC
MNTVLVIDDDPQLRSVLADTLARDSLDVHTADSGRDGLAAAEQTAADVILLDLRLPDMDGVDVLRALRNQQPDAAVIIITGHGDIESAVGAIRGGAADYIEKPFRGERLRLAVARALREVVSRRELRRLHSLASDGSGLDQIVGDSPPTQQLRALVRDIARSPAPTVLITGESGTGKELVARALHHESSRRDHPFMEINCAAISETLFESEIFGHEKGAFTDAHMTKKGLMELADGGTLLLDEISEMAPGSQAKMLRCLQERVFRRVGGTRDIRVDVRVVACTNRPLHELVAAGRFRADLYYRLTMMPLVVPALRERREDIVPLARHFLVAANRTFHKGIQGFTTDTEDALIAYEWPGNVRELRNLVERVVLLEEGERVECEHLPSELLGRRFASEGAAGSADDVSMPTLAQMEAEHIGEVLRLTAGNKSRAARILGISRQGLIEKLRRLRMDEDARRQVS